MPDLLTPTFLTALIAGGLLAAVPLLFASLGEIIAEQAGVLNVGPRGHDAHGRVRRASWRPTLEPATCGWASSRARVAGHARLAGHGPVLRPAGHGPDRRGHRASCSPPKVRQPAAHGAVRHRPTRASTRSRRSRSRSCGTSRSWAAASSASRCRSTSASSLVVVVGWVLRRTSWGLARPRGRRAPRLARRRRRERGARADRSPS